MERLNPIGAKDAIDVVIAWVDGRDRKHRAKRRRYLADPGVDAKPERSATDQRRFSDNDEIRFCLRSIRNYAPWVRTIWLVTDHQVPAAIDRQKAERDNIRVVDHREIFRGYEQLLPTFNSLAIETMLWRIEGLADRFLYFNDDMMFVGPVEPTDFFSNEGRVTLRGRWTSWNELLERGNTFNGHNKLLGAEMLGYTSERFFFFRSCDLPIAATGDGGAVRAVQTCLPRERRVPIPRSQAVLAHLGARPPVAQVGPVTSSETPRRGAFLGAVPAARSQTPSKRDCSSLRMARRASPASMISRRSWTRCPMRWTIYRRQPGHLAAFEKPSSRETHVSRLLSWRHR